MRRVTRQDKDPLFISSVVLVKEGQSGQKFWLAPNLEEVNSRVQLPAHPMVDCQSVLDQLSGAKLLSAQDVKAAFNNIPLPAHLEKYCGIITQYSLYVCTVMAWGFNAAPCHYQDAMNQVMRADHPIVPRPWQRTYLDDVTGAGRDVGEAWNNTLACLSRIALSG